MYKVMSQTIVLLPVIYSDVRSSNFFLTDRWYSTFSVTWENSEKSSHVIQQE